MADDPLLRQQARDAILAGKLPTRRYDRMLGGPGSEQPCEVCRKTLPRAEVEIELEFDRHGATPGIERFHFHHRCYAAFERGRVELSEHAVDVHARAKSMWYRVAGLSRRKELAIEIIEAEIRSTQREVWLEAARLVLTGEPIEIARQLRERAERTIRPK